ncbi:50S ribosomal protein L11 methyltransferase [bacterium]|nr:50S ribosomal protein L11 methyltransferase [bacterium]
MKTSKKNQWYWETVVLCPKPFAELLSGLLFEKNASGIEELESTGKSVRLKIFFKSDDYPGMNQLKSVIEELIDRIDQLKLVTIEQKEFQDWQSNWKEHFKPILVGNSFVIRPPWEMEVSGKKEIVIQPGLGFGTGYHESTNLAIQLIEWISGSFSYKTVIDVGTGSGILTIAALLTGAENVLAIDIDEDAISEVKQNLKFSGIDPSKCEVRVTEINNLTQPADLVLANIEDFILIPLSKDLIRLVKPGGLLVLSGILAERKQETINSFSPGMTVIKELELAEWYSAVMSKKAFGFQT